MAEGSAGSPMYGSRQLSTTHSHSLKGRLQCSCPVSLCFTVPYFILSMLEHCSNVSPCSRRTHLNMQYAHYILVNMPTIGHLTHRLNLNLN